MVKKALIIIHSAGSQTNYVTKFFTERTIPFEILPVFDADDQLKLFDIHTTDYLVIVSLGGPQGTYEENLYPYLTWEKSFLAAQLALNTPILGVCLGAQLVADAIGGRGYLGKYGYEIGYVQYELTSHGKDDPVISKVFQKYDNKPFLVMHHKDSFDLPSHASVLAYTSNNYIAAFRIGSALGVQFHPEASFSDFNRWVQRTREMKPKSYEHLNVDEILCQGQANEIHADKSRETFFEHWWNSLHI